MSRCGPKHLGQARVKIAAVHHLLFNLTWQKYLKYIVLYIKRVGFNIIVVFLF